MYTGSDSTSPTQQINTGKFFKKKSGEGKDIFFEKQPGNFRFITVNIGNLVQNKV